MILLRGESMPNYVRDKNLETDLLQDGQIGDVDTFSSLLEIYRPRLLSYLKRKVYNQDLAEELIQETFLKAYLAMPAIDKNFKFSSWIFTIARNVCIDYWRYTKIRPIHVPYNAEQLAPEQKHTHSEKILESNERKGIILKTLNKLPIRQKTAITLRDIEGYSYREAAYIMSLTEAAFTSLLYRARTNFVQEVIPILYPRAKKLVSVIGSA